ncbi:MAG: alkaline phosphatase family protein, partial [Candidatus Sulfotelmatobacter sp.]
MGRPVFLCLSVLLLAAGAVLLSLNGCSSSNSPGGSSSSGTIPLGKFQHVVVIFQENRTPDNLFHDPVLMAKGADIASSGLNSSGDTVPLTATPLGVDYDLGHQHASFLAMYDGGKMDGADKVQVSCYGGNCPPNPQFMYVQASDVGPYFQMAEQYAFGDRMFQTNQGPSFPAHQFIISGTSAPTATSNLFVAENAGGVSNAGTQTGCLA